MNRIFKRLPLAVAVSMALPIMAQAQETKLESVVVTAPTMEAPLTVTTDPKAPRQPLPAHDGADMLKSIPGFSVIRKGGTDGDPVFRGMSGSRLGILLDGQEIHGGCGGRMDPPTAYIYPESYDRVTVLKGPQQVLYVPGSSAGVVLFERESKRMTEPGWSAQGSLTFGSFGRNDQYLEVRGGNPDFYARANATRSDSDNYEDGDGEEVHSFYTRWSTSAALGWTPDDNTLIELSAGRSDGEAAYADRAMDGTKFERENVALKFEKRNISSLVNKVEANVYYSYIDHVMDNYSLRSNTGMKMLNNPDRETKGGRVAVTLTPAEPLQLVLGADMKTDEHTFRDGTNYFTKPRTGDLSFDRYGVFGEATYALDDVRRVVGGLRVDDHEVTNDKMGGITESETLPSGFLRYENDYASGAGTWYVGLGHAERFPDYWEYMRTANLPRSGDARTFTTLDPEKTTQLDVGANWTHGEWSAAVSGFYSKVDDYILLRWVTPVTANVRNVDATVYGLEGDVTWRFAPNWQAYGTLAWVRGTNDTDNKPLAQQPPLEAKLGVEYDNRVFSYGAMVRMVAKQDRYDIGSGSIVANGQDLGATPGFATLALNAGYRPNKTTLLTVGVDNVFDRTYREHLGKGGWDFGSAKVTDLRINEPGRTLWLKAQVALD
jgi:iron complex outermembrane receptor protein